MKQPDLLMSQGAQFSSCRRYRYSLWRIWGDGPLVCFVMLNPSTADAIDNDPTVERCTRRARMLGYGGLRVVNLFAYRSTDPGVLRGIADPIGQFNDASIICSAALANTVICAWGNHGAFMGRGAKVLAKLREHNIAPHALRITGAGQPEHPLYLPYSLEPFVIQEEAA